MADLPVTPRERFRTGSARVAGLPAAEKAECRKAVVRSGGTDAMDDDVREFGDRLGRRAIARDWNSVHTMLAPWLRSAVSADDVRTFFEDEYRETLSANEVEGMHYPEHPEPQVGGNGFTNATELRKPISFAGGKVRPVAAELTDENFRFWMHLELPCSDAQMETLGFDTFCDVWMAVAQTPEGLRVGYWSHGAY